MDHFLPRVWPESLAPLVELALDLRWTWSHAGDALWRRLDASLWEQTRNPWVILQNLSQQNLEKLVADPGFQQELRRLIDERERYGRESGWFAATYSELGIRTVAYFSMEFGLGEAFPLYAGGLGVLAGDYLKTASDLGLPIVGIGLLYQEGYFRQMIDASGQQREAYPYNNPADLPIQPVMGPTGAWLRIPLEFPGRTVYLRAWQANVGRVQLYLLDSNDLLNGPGDRGITAKLYDGAAEMRLLQEIVLGIGGWSLLVELGIDADVCHLNEGHAAFAVVERARRYMLQKSVSFREAWWATRAGNVFTTHTPVTAGFDTFAPELIRQYFREYWEKCNTSVQELIALGRRDPKDETEPFNMAYLALRGCVKANAVSRLHGQVSRRLFRDLFPAWPEWDVPIEHVTNGVHVPSWDSVWADELWTSACGKDRWLGGVTNLVEAIRAKDDATLWGFAAMKRRDLVLYTRERLVWQLKQRGEERGRIAEAADVFDPNVLTLGFARRFAEYKRPNLLLQDPDRLARLLLNPQRPVQIIVAGKAHPEDKVGKKLVREWLEFVNRPQVRARAVFLEDYDMALAQQLVQGVDLWINTPRRPWEACGTSGMKVLVNGGLNVSTLDGWWAEAYSPEVGWAIGAPDDTATNIDSLDAERLYQVLEREAAPMFYERDARGLPVAWIARMRASIAELAPRFSSNRMLKEYVEKIYGPAAAAYRRRSDSGRNVARSLLTWETKTHANWREVHFGRCSVEQRADAWSFEVQVYFGEIEPDWVMVELCADAAPEGPPVRQMMVRGSAIAGAMNGFVFRANVPASRPQWHYTPRVTAFHPEAQIPLESALILWQR
ncbi:MAG TPA: alpha-glucan family phosphorylase [Burkholderiaceae bacterium]|nr:alpha-glucan family phosphorylase [Burkholderiaceae bacterium]